MRYNADRWPRIWDGFGTFIRWKMIQWIIFCFLGPHGSPVFRSSDIKNFGHDLEMAGAGISPTISSYGIARQLAMERSTRLLRTVNHLFLWAIYTMVNCSITRWYIVVIYSASACPQPGGAEFAEQFDREHPKFHQGNPTAPWTTLM